MTNKRVAILGTVPQSRALAPYHDPSWDIWCCSPGNSTEAPPRVTVWFELHSMADMKDPENTSWFPNYIHWLNLQVFTIFMQERNPEVPKALPFPRRPLLERWGPTKHRTNWFTSSVTWLMAYAMHLGYEEIGIYGVDMSVTDEAYSLQKAGILRFCEFADELGIKITVPLESTLLFGLPLYGYAEQTRMGRSLIVREQETKAKIRECTEKIQVLVRQKSFFEGALDQISFDRRTFVSGYNDVEITEGLAVASKGNGATMPPEVERQPLTSVPRSAYAVAEHGKSDS